MVYFLAYFYFYTWIKVYKVWHEIGNTQKDTSETSKKYINVFLRNWLKFWTFPFLNKKLLIFRNCRYRITIAYSCYTNWTIKIKSLNGKLFYLTRIFSRNSAWIFVEGNGTIDRSDYCQYQVLVCKLFCFVKGIYYSFNATEINDFSCF